MHPNSAVALALVVSFLSAPVACAFGDEPARNASAADKKNVLSDPKVFPIAVWLQSPANAPRFREAGINLYVGLWQGPNEKQLTELKKHEMPVICEQNAMGLAHKDDPTIVGWMHGDEPDNAQSLGRGQTGYGPPIPPAKIVEDYQRIKRADPSRPVMLNLGQGVAWDGWFGRGVRTNHPEDYPEYVRGGDIISYDIYPACHTHRDVAGKLWFVADGVSRLKKWCDARSEDRKTVWNCIECTHIDNPDAKATPAQVKAEVWMSLIRGSRGLIYFVHQFKPTFIEAGLLADPEMLAAVTAINRQIHELAPVLNSPSVADGVTVESSAGDVPVEAMVKRHEGTLYIFAVGMRDGKTRARFKIAGRVASAKVEVLGENRSLELKDGEFADDFAPWGVHLYRIK
jgi:hypothetical protein